MNRVMPPTAEKRLTMIDLFAGAGGLSHGFRAAGYDVLGGTDHDPDAMATFARNFPEARALTGDIREDEIRDGVVEIGRSADVIVGGPPCQAFSQVRNHSRIIDDPRNTLYREFVRVVGEIEPRAFVMENVQGMAQMGVRDQVLQDLIQGGRYRVRAQIVDASDFGVPQTRKRLIFTGVHSDLAIEPPTFHGSGASQALTLLPDSDDKRGYRLALRNDAVASELLDRLQDPTDLDVVSTQQAIGDLVALEAGRRDDTIARSALPSATSAYQTHMRTAASVSNLSVPRMNGDTTLRLNAIPAGGNYRDLPEHLQARYLTGQKWGPSNGTERLSRRHYYAYRRLHPDLWAWTLNTKADAVYHFMMPRALSVREFCRIQSFSDDFVVVTDPRAGKITGRVPNGATHSKYRQIGNAVPPLLARAIGLALADKLRASSEQSVGELV